MEVTKILDKKYFKEINTKEKAYFFGLLYWELNTGKKEQVKTISEKMYEDTELFLIRKKEKFKI